MGILNVTPDSFSDRGNFLDPDQAAVHGRRMLAEGASIIDVGGESTRPGAESVSGDEERERVLPVIRMLAEREPEALLSIDTTKAAVARAALEAGAHIVNDVSGLRADPEMADLVAQSGAGLILMHMRGTPRTMQKAPHYEDVVSEIRHFFESQLSEARAAGVKPAQIVLDPGIGFGKSLEHNLAILRQLERLRVDGRPLALGVSRKSFFQRLLHLPVNDRTLATAIVTALTARNGVEIHRVHDVAANRQALDLVRALDPGADSLGP